MTELIIRKYSINGNHAAPFGYIASIDSVALPGDAKSSARSCQKYRILKSNDGCSATLLLIEGQLEFQSTTPESDEILTKVAATITITESNSHESIVEEIKVVLSKLAIKGDSGEKFGTIWVLTSGFNSESANCSSIRFHGSDKCPTIAVLNPNVETFFTVAPLGSNCFPKQAHLDAIITGSFENNIWLEHPPQNVEFLKKYSKLNPAKILGDGYDKQEQLEGVEWHQGAIQVLSSFATSVGLRPYSMKPIHIFDVSTSAIRRMS